MNKIRTFSKKYLIGFMLGIISGSLVIAYADTYFPSSQTTYDNSASGLSSTNVQGAIDELYNVCFPPIPAGDQILENTDIVSSGDGLYADEYEDGKYTYKGKNPNNYVTFNDEEAGWRIISINSDGTIKIMRDASIGDIAWDDSDSNNWNRPASLNTYLNSTYYSSLTSISKSQIVEGIYNIGVTTSDNIDITDQINDENSVTSKVKIALPTLSEFLRANSNKEQCGTSTLHNHNYSICKDSDWMFNADDNWMLTPNSSYPNTVFQTGTYGDITFNYNGAKYAKNAVRPTVILSSSVQITGGDGSKSNPFTLG